MRAPSPTAAAQVTLSPKRLRSTPLMVPRTVCACQPVSAVICSIVPPLGERSRAITGEEKALESLIRNDRENLNSFVEYLNRGVSFDDLDEDLKAWWMDRY